MEEKSLDKLEFNKSIKVCSFKDNPKKKKKASHKREEIRIQRLVCRIYREFLQSIIKTNKNWVKTLNRHFTIQDIKIASRHKKNKMVSRLEALLRQAMSTAPGT